MKRFNVDETTLKYIRVSCSGLSFQVLCFILDQQKFMTLIKLIFDKNLMLQGYHVTIYDLGGSKSFRGIWPKYYHEVHGFIFVVDSADQGRLAECSSVLRAMLDHHQVRGKPILLLANKADAELAQVGVTTYCS